VIVHHAEVMHFLLRTEARLSLLLLGPIVIDVFLIYNFYVPFAQIHRASTCARYILWYKNNLLVVKNTAINFELLILLSRPLPLLGQIGVNIILLLRTGPWDASGEATGLAGMLKSIWDVILDQHVIVIVFAWLLAGLKEDLVAWRVDLGVHHVVVRLLTITVIIGLLSHRCVDLVPARGDLNWQFSDGWIARARLSVVSLSPLTRFVLIAERCNRLCPHVFSLINLVRLLGCLILLTRTAKVSV
jgi:hypothetical protein